MRCFFVHFCQKLDRNVILMTSPQKRALTLIVDLQLLIMLGIRLFIPRILQP